MIVTQVSGNWKGKNIVWRRYPSSEPPQCWCEVSCVLLCFVSLAGQGGKMLTAPFVCFFLYWWLKQLWNSSVMLSPSKIAAIVIPCRPQWELCRNSNWCRYVCLLLGYFFLSFVFFYNATQIHLYFFLWRTGYCFEWRSSYILVTFFVCIFICMLAIINVLSLYSV